jgi:hypothetical protein
MSCFAITLSTCAIAMIRGGGGAALLCTSAEAATVSSADAVALSSAIVACKAEARGKRVAGAMSEPWDMKDLPTEKWDAT